MRHSLSRLLMSLNYLRLRCYVVIDLKVDEFKPEYGGKVNFYLSAVDDLLRHPADAPSVLRRDQMTEGSRAC